MRAWAAAGLVGAILCAGCSATPGPPGAASTASAPSRTTGSRAATTDTGIAAPDHPASDAPRSPLQHLALAPLGELDSPFSTPTQAALEAMQEIWLAIPHDRYAGVVPGGGAGIIVGTLPVVDPRLAALLRTARRHGVIVEIQPARRSLAALELLGDTVFRRLPEPLRGHALVTKVDVTTNRVVVGFDLPIDDALRAQVARVYGDSVAVVHVDGPSFAVGA